MTSIQFKPQEYINLLKMSNDKHLLVEGRSDTFFFEILFEEFLGIEWKDEDHVTIDSAEALISSDGLKAGNRDKVENICNIYDKNNLLGFVDREFREFETGDKLIDRLRTHYQTKRLIWSRGHSIENYFFDAEILRDAFRDICPDGFTSAYKMFRRHLNSYLQIACVLSIIGLVNNNNIEAIKHTIRWEIINSDGSFNTSAWEKELLSHTKLNSKDVNRIIELFPRILLLTRETDIETVRWLCHGHIGSVFLWQSFARYIYDAATGEEISKIKAVQAFVSYQRRLEIKLCSRSWAKAASTGRAEYPQSVFKLLNLG